MKSPTLSPRCLQAEQLFREGHTYSAVGRKLGVSMGAVYRMLERVKDVRSLERVRASLRSVAR